MSNRDWERAEQAARFYENEQVRIAGEQALKAAEEELAEKSLIEEMSNALTNAAKSALERAQQTGDYSGVSMVVTSVRKRIFRGEEEVKEPGWLLSSNRWSDFDSPNGGEGYVYLLARGAFFETSTSWSWGGRSTTRRVTTAQALAEMNKEQGVHHLLSSLGRIAIPRAEQ